MLRGIFELELAAESGHGVPAVRLAGVLVGAFLDASLIRDAAWEARTELTEAFETISEFNAATLDAETSEATEAISWRGHGNWCKNLILDAY